MKQLQRLLFLQGNRCFFCDQPIPTGEESIEHLSARANGGEKSEENSVVCCKSVNAALGSLSIKEKFRAILSYRSGFTCPRLRSGEVAAHQSNQSHRSEMADALMPQVVANLKKRGSKRPGKLVTLRNAVACSFPSATPEVIELVLQKLKKTGYVAEKGSKVSYPKLESGS